MDDLLALLGGNRTDLAAWRADQGAFHHTRRPLFIQKRHQCFAHAQFQNHLLDIDLGVGAKGLGRRLNRLLILGGECPHRMLDPVAKLAKNPVRDVNRILGDKKTPTPLERTRRTTW